jgi:competence protein ComEC
MSIGLRLVVAFVIGTPLGVLCDHEFALIAALGVCSVVCVIVWPRQTTIGLLALMTGATVGASARVHALRSAPSHLITPDPVLLTGVLLSDAAPSPAGIRLDLQMDGWRVRAVVTGAMAESTYREWTRGRTIAAPIRLRQPDLVRNPGSPSDTWQRLTRRFDVIGTVKSAALIDVSKGAWWQEWSAAVRAHVRRTTTALFSPYSASVVTAILIGDRAGLDDEVMRRLQAAGTFHVIAISGGNVAMLTMVCFVVLRLVTRSLIFPVVATTVIVIVYGVVVGGEPSVTRAVVAAVIYLLLRLVGLNPQPVNLLAVVAVVCIVMDPLVVVDVGAWLSFGATLGLIVVLPRLLRAARGSDDHPIGWARVWDWLRAAVLATVAAEILIMPVTAGVFARVGVAGLLLNLVAIPAMAVVQFAGLAACGLALVWIPAASAAADVAHIATVVLLGSSTALELAPWLSWRVPPSSLWWTSGYYVALAAAVWWTRARWRQVAIAVACVLLAVIVSAPFVSWSRPARGWMRVSVLDVGQGDAILVQTPNGRALLVDAGGTPAGTYDVGGRVVTPAVWALGERRLEWLVVSHGDLDHVGGAARVMEDLSPREVWEGIPVESSAVLQELRHKAQARHVTWRRVLAGHELEVGGVHVVVHHPTPPDWQRVRVRNDDSVVLEVRYGDVSFLLTGDAGVEFESVPIVPPRSGAPARIRVLKVAHHGSRSSTAPTFLEHLAPRVALISAGAGNMFGHPAPDVIARLVASDVHTFRTDRHGAVIVETDGRVVRVRGTVGPRLEVF